MSSIVVRFASKRHLICQGAGQFRRDQSHVRPTRLSIYEIMCPGDVVVAAVQAARRLVGNIKANLDQ
jgi:hypothetical protein